jgi:hypothetical protein
MNGVDGCLIAIALRWWLESFALLFCVASTLPIPLVAVVLPTSALEVFDCPGQAFFLLSSEIEWRMRG